MTQETTPADILAFWREAGPEKWFAKNDGFDAEIARRFGSTHRAAHEGRLDGWADTPEGALALIITLDQFPRNMFRGEARAFASDPKALGLARRAVESGADARMPADLKSFAYLPFEHSEDLVDQDRSVALYAPIGGETARYAEIHRDIIVRFGRFPHRNAILGRATTPEEQAFLDEGGFAG